MPVGILSGWRVYQQMLDGYELHGSIKEADCIVGFSFGFRRENGLIQPGLANRRLAFIAGLEYKLPKILQFEIADALPEHRPEDAWNWVIRIERHRREGKYLDTREVADHAANWMWENAWRRAAVLAHPHHLARCDVVLQKLGVETVVPVEWQDKFEAVHAFYDPESEQEWTQTPEQWAKRERMACLLYGTKGWI